jgi:hypothetical protein
MNAARLPTTYYSPADWARLSPAQRSQILNARGTKSNISALETDYQGYQDISDNIFHAEEYVGGKYDHTFMNYSELASQVQIQPQPQHIQDALSSMMTDNDDNIPAQSQTNAGNQFGQHSRAHYLDSLRYIGIFESSPRTMVRRGTTVTVSHVAVQPQQQQESSIELDSHADTTCAGANCRVIAYTDKVCSISPYHPK